MSSSRCVRERSATSITSLRWAGDQGRPAHKDCGTVNPSRVEQRGGDLGAWVAAGAFDGVDRRMGRDVGAGPLSDPRRIAGVLVDFNMAR